MWLQTVLALLIVPAVLGQRSQFDTDCPSRCHCNQTAVLCEQADARSSSIFLTVLPVAYPDLDTIIVTGNSLGDLSGSNLFAENTVHQGVSLFNLSQNHITAIDDRTFQGLPALEFFFLDHNTLEHIGADPFRWNSRLRRLDISSLFSHRVGPAERTRMLDNMFSSSANSFVDLTELIVRENALAAIEPQTLCKIQGLIRLDLTGNKLSTFPVSEGCLINLQLLELSGNNIRNLPVAIFEALPVLTTIDISLNPLHCDCDLAPFIKRIAATASAALNQGRTTCASPPSRRGLNALDVTDFDCSTHHFLLTFLFVLAAATAIVILIRHYRHRLRTISIPLIAGYSKLGDNDVAAPQFV